MLARKQAVVNSYWLAPFPYISGTPSFDSLVHAEPARLAPSIYPFFFFLSWQRPLREGSPCWVGKHESIMCIINL